jgi:hypothetical protein
LEMVVCSMMILPKITLRVYMNFILIKQNYNMEFSSNKIIY